MLHGVDEDLPERQHHLVAVGLGEVLAQLGEEPHEALHRQQAAVDPERDPVGPGGDDLDPLVPVGGGHRPRHHVRELRQVPGGGEEGEHPGAQGGDDLLRRRPVGEDDGADPGPGQARLLEEHEVVPDRRVRVGQDDVVGADAQPAQRLRVGGGGVDGGPLQQGRGAEGAGHLGGRVDEQNPRHAGHLAALRARVL